MARPERSHLEAHYADLSGRGFFAGLIDYMVSIDSTLLFLQYVIDCMVSVDDYVVLQYVVSAVGYPVHHETL